MGETLFSARRRKPHAGGVCSPKYAIASLFDCGVWDKIKSKIRNGLEPPHGGCYEAPSWQLPHPVKSLSEGRVD